MCIGSLAWRWLTTAVLTIFLSQTSESQNHTINGLIGNIDIDDDGEVLGRVTVM